MLKVSKIYAISVIIFCLFALYISLPSFLNEEARQKYSHLLYSKTINLGLDLQGGSHLLLQADFESYIKEQLENLEEELKLALREQNIGYRNFSLQEDEDVIAKLSFSLREFIEDTEQANSLLKPIFQDYSEEISYNISDAGAVEVFYKEGKIKELRRSILAETIQIVRRRVDQTGTREPIIQRKGVDQIILQVPGLEDPETLKNLLGKTAKMTFHLMSETNPFPGSRVPATIEERLLQDDEGKYYLIKSRAIITGDMLKSASPGRDEFNMPAVNFDFNTLGGKKFAEITRNNIGKPFAIVLDGKVISAPVIRTAITGGSGQISGGFTEIEANRLAIMLRAGALPAPIKILEERTVGASLGQDSIERGQAAATIAVILVICAMLYFYKIYGIFATISLMMSMIFITMALVFLQATLTLPGIAGIVLTLGMAVDANVLIYERIKEEVKKGINYAKATSDGFNYAFKTIIDSNLTTLIATFLLFFFGYGPVKGFAITLSIGILASMFSALVLNRAIVFSYVAKRKSVNI